MGSHHYADAFLADGWDVFWVSHPLSPLHYVHPDKKDFAIRHEAWRRGPLAYGRLRYYSPFTLLPAADRPVLRAPFFAENAALATMPGLGRVLERAGFGEPDVVWLTNPVFLPLAQRLRTRALAVRVADDNAAFRDVPPAVAAMERRALDAADVVFVVAEELYERMASQRAGVVRLPNAVDFAHFAKDAVEPADLAGIPHPRVLYVGATAYWFDVELVAQAAAALPHASFVLVGPLAPGVKAALGDVPNVHLLGPRPYGELPGYMRHADAGIVPFRETELVQSIHPIKVYEYLAAGLPVVAVSWRELARMAPPATLVPRGGFVRALTDTLARGAADGREARVAYARVNSWQERYEVIRDALAPRLGEQR